MTKYELSSNAIAFYNSLRDKGLSHSLALMATVEFVLGNAAKVGASNDAEKEDYPNSENNKGGSN